MVALAELYGCRPVPVPMGIEVQSLQFPAVTVRIDLLVMMVVPSGSSEEVREMPVPEITPVPEAVGPGCG